MAFAWRREHVEAGEFALLLLPACPAFPPASFLIHPASLPRCSIALNSHTGHAALGPPPRCKTPPHGSSALGCAARHAERSSSYIRSQTQPPAIHRAAACRAHRGSESCIVGCGRGQVRACLSVYLTSSLWAPCLQHTNSSGIWAHTAEPWSSPSFPFLLAAPIPLFDCRLEAVELARRPPNVIEALFSSAYEGVWLGAKESTSYIGRVRGKEGRM